MKLADPKFSIQLPNLDAHDGLADLYKIPLASYDWNFITLYHKCAVTKRHVFKRNDFTGLMTQISTGQISVN